ncbi:MAG TPA: 3-deoxy-8-phosphooctulonate synthase, partial [Lysobacter sp.]|nr:3-deoxy-8-phosphooctulonate synthase [Lysobacter sp.]
PCVIESMELQMETAGKLKEITSELGIPFIFKSSFDKANRTSISGFRGPGVEEGLKVLSEVKRQLGLPVLTDVHEYTPIDEVASVVDVLQTPAFLVRQTDFITKVCSAGKPVNIKKGQFLAPWDMKPVVEKAKSTGNTQIMVCERGASFGYNNLAARYVPSAATQRARQVRLPSGDALRRDLGIALADSPFLPDAFDGFVEDVETARNATPLTPRELAGTPLASAVEGLLVSKGDGATALVTLTGLADPAAASRALAGSGAQLMDLKQASESLVADYRGRVLWALALAAVLLAATVWIALRSPRRVARVLAPMALTTLLILAVLRLCGVELNLFHLVALILAAGLGLDYALFFDHAGDDPDEQVRALHAILVCSATTMLVFSLLGLSSIPVLRAIGLTVTIGVVANFVLALAIVRHAPPAEAA